MKKVTVFSTVGQSRTIIETEATTWGELKPLFEEKGVQHENMRIIIGETKTQLVSDASVLPEGDFKIFTTPLKTKSGAEKNLTRASGIETEATETAVDNLSYIQLRTVISNIVETTPGADKFFEGYANMTSFELRRALKKFNEEGIKTPAGNVAVEEELVESVRTLATTQVTLVNEYNKLVKVLGEDTPLLGAVDSIEQTVKAIKDLGIVDKYEQVADLKDEWEEIEEELN